MAISMDVGLCARSSGFGFINGLSEIKFFKIEGKNGKTVIVKVVKFYFIQVVELV